LFFPLVAFLDSHGAGWLQSFLSPWQ
jgi:hypothetical protein